MKLIIAERPEFGRAIGAALNLVSALGGTMSGSGIPWSEHLAICCSCATLHSMMNALRIGHWTTCPGYLLIEFSQAEDAQTTDDEDITEIVKHLIRENRSAYKELI